MRDDRRHGPVKQQDQRPAGASDRDRILHCSALRRLAGVTQVVAPEEGHVFHNRLTHSMKVGQIERIVKRTGHSQSELQLAWDSAAPFAIEDRYLGTSAQRAALREWTSQMIQRYVQAVKFDAQNRLSVHTKIRREIEVLKGLTWEYVIESPMLATQQMGHRKVINGLFDAYLDASVNHTSVLPPRFRDYLQREQLHDQIYDSLTPDQRPVRTVADIIASMTDIEALRMYRRLHGFLPGSLSDAQLM